MGFSILFLFLISSALHINLTSSAEIALDFRRNCTGNFTANSTYAANLNLLFSKLVDQDFNHGFYNTSVGQRPDQVNAIALCRGDIKEDICRSCLKNTTYALQQTCPNKKEAIGWSEFCTLHYSNRQIYRNMETDPFDEIWRVDNSSRTSDVYCFNGDLNLLLNNLSSKAATGGTLFKYAADFSNVSVSPSGIYALVQCTPDLSQQYCSACLAVAIARMWNYCPGITGCRIAQPSCFLRYEIDLFFHEDSTDITIVPVSPPSPSPTEDRKEKEKLIIIITITAIIIATIFICCTFFLRRHMHKRRVRNENTEDILLFDRGKTSTSKVELGEVTLFKFVELATSTNNFNTANLLGQGGFGPVYRGTLQNDQEIAVKRLSRASGQGVDEFKNEVLVISHLQHRNLVKLLGCCVEGEEKILVYEYMPNNSLDTYLFDLPKKELLDWGKRFNIIEGISQGLLYLHRHSRLRIIHRDLKASNILLDEKLQPKISDFGLARIFGDSEDQANTKRVVGTYGYMPPEYAMEGLFSEKSDVYSYGVLQLEIVSGRRNTSFYNDEHLSLVGYAWKLWNEGNILALVDNMVADPSHHEEVLRCIHVGLLCVQEFAKDRPNMSTVISMLNSEIVDLPRPKQPAFTQRQNNASDAESPAQHDQQRCSLNNVTLSTVEGR